MLSRPDWMRPWVTRLDLIADSALRLDWVTSWDPPQPELSYDTVIIIYSQGSPDGTKVQPKALGRVLALWSKLMTNSKTNNLPHQPISAACCPVYHAHPTHSQEEVPKQTLQYLLVKWRQTVSQKKFYCSWPSKCSFKAGYSFTEVCTSGWGARRNRGAKTERRENAFPLAPQHHTWISQPPTGLFSLCNRTHHTPRTVPAEKPNCVGSSTVLPSLGYFPK